MGNFNIKNVTETKTYAYAGESLNVEGEVTYRPSDEKIINVTGSFYEKAEPETGINGALIGNFSGQNVDSELKYTLYGMGAADAAKAAVLIEDVDAHLVDIIHGEPEEPELEPVEEPSEE